MRWLTGCHEYYECHGLPDQTDGDRPFNSSMAIGTRKSDMNTDSVIMSHITLPHTDTGVPRNKSPSLA